MLFNPKKAQFDHLDERSRKIMQKTIDFMPLKNQIRGTRADYHLTIISIKQKAVCLA